MIQKYNILLVEDDPSLGFVVKDNLLQAGFNITLKIDGKAGYEEFMKNRFDLCLFDVMLPEKDGFSLAEDIRKSDKKVPIIFLTAKSMEIDRIKGFKLGGDDYITKPFSMEELILRIKAILKRTNETVEDDKDLYIIGEYEFRHKSLELIHPTTKKLLTKKESELLRLLCINSNSVLERETALKIVWGEDDYFLGRSMDVFISKLRKYLKADPSIKIINVHGVGFKLEVN
ncbi:MAG: response regulator transcription factor [Flavobacteriales bacterium]|nr:response regulator transcription factor [Flavobacteriales bacterium]